MLLRYTFYVSTSTYYCSNYFQCNFWENYNRIFNRFYDYSSSYWTEFSETNNIVKTFKRNFYHVFPTKDKMVSEIRTELSKYASLKYSDFSRASGIKFINDNNVKHKPPKYVVLVIVDAMRKANYCAESKYAENLPGFKELRKSFVEYNNCWMSYNATLGSVPTILNGALSPIRYKISLNSAGKCKNTIYKAAKQYGYNVQDFSSLIHQYNYWSKSVGVDVSDKNKGILSAKEVFSASLNKLSEAAADKASPLVLQMLHLYNIHEPYIQKAFKLLKSLVI